MQINKLLTPYNHNEGTIDRIKYIVIHYVGALGGAEANCKWYAGGNRSASAHYFVGHQGEVWQSVEDKDIAWHCGAKSYVHPECRNANSIGVEMCVRNNGSTSSTSRDWYFEDETVTATVELVKALMEKYNIPAEHVIRHYDVTGKICPNPYVYNEGNHTWQQFRKEIEPKEPYNVGWYHDDKGWWYADTVETYYHDCWQNINGHRYYFDQDGYAVTGQQVINGQKYLFEDETGHPLECALYVSRNDGALYIGEF